MITVYIGNAAVGQVINLPRNRERAFPPNGSEPVTFTGYGFAEMWLRERILEPRRAEIIKHLHAEKPIDMPCLCGHPNHCHFGGHGHCFRCRNEQPDQEARFAFDEAQDGGTLIPGNAGSCGAFTEPRPD